MQKGRIAIYFHWPFCISKCPYCDFNTHISENIDHDRWKAAYLKSLEYYAQSLGNDRQVVSVFFGGGTPSLMKPQTVQAILDKIYTLWPVSDSLEITLEANPTSVETARLEAFAAAGINRVSLGVQSLRDADLKFLGRQHSAAQAMKAIEEAQRVFKRCSFDLMYARPGQTLSAWESELTGAVDLAAGHLSLYQLTIERNTPFYFDVQQGKFSMPDEDDGADFYHLTQDILKARGLPRYEVSNHARPGEESRHNMIYWRGEDYIGIGPGAHGRLTIGRQRFATRDHHAPDIWLDRVEEMGHGAHPYDLLDSRSRFIETLMMGLRLAEGLPLQKLAQAGGELWQDYLIAERIEAVKQAGWLSERDSQWRLSREGVLRINALIPYILA